MEDKEKVFSEMMESNEFKEIMTSMATASKELQDSLQSTFSRLSESLKAWELRNEIEFKKTLKSVKYKLRQKGLVLPKDWKEVYYEWYLKKYEEEFVWLTSADLTKKIGDRQILIQWAIEYSEQFEIIPKEQSEKLKNLPHKLCILEELGFMELIDERFKDKNYYGKARESDKARLIASLFDIDDPERIRNTLRKKDFLSEKQKNNAVQTLKNHSLKSIKFTD